MLEGNDVRAESSRRSRLTYLLVPQDFQTKQLTCPTEDSLHPFDYRTYYLLYSTLPFILTIITNLSLLPHPIVRANSCYLFTCSSLSYCRRQHWNSPDTGFAPQSVIYPTYLGGAQATL